LGRELVRQAEAAEDVRGRERRGRKVEQTIWQVLEVKDGLVVSWRVFRTESEALEAAGP